MVWEHMSPQVRSACHSPVRARLGKEMWLASSTRLDELPPLWDAGADVVCVRSAACTPGKVGGRFGAVSTAIVQQLIQTIP